MRVSIASVDLKAALQRADRFQQRHRWLAVAVAVAKKFSDDGASRQAALVAYYAFFSLFPLLLVFVTALGFVLHGDRSAQRAIEHSVLAQFPILGTRIHPASLHGSAIGLAIGIVTSLLSGLGVTGAMQNALNTVWAVPIKDRPGFVPSRLRGLALLALIGVLFGASSAAAGLVSGGLGGSLAKIGGIAVSLAVDVALFAASFRLMTPPSVPWRDLRLGVLVAACFWEILQAAGGYYIGHVLAHTQSDLADVSLVIGLLLFLHLGAQVTLYAAEINVVVSRRLWPRSYFSSPDVPADERVLQALAKAQERSERQHIEVAFEKPQEGG
jgi:membrane protein